MSQITITENIAKLEELFNIFNSYFYNNELKNPIIALMPNTGNRRIALGWCTVRKIWKDVQNNKGFYEISICPEFMDRSIYEICATLLHEMVHLYNLQKGIQDCSRNNQYHNKKFKREAERRGLSISFDKKIGWSKTELTEDTKGYIDNNLDIKITPLCRGGKYFIINNDNDGESEEEKKKTSWKYVCPNCNNSVRATKEVNVICGDCEESMEEET